MHSRHATVMAMLQRTTMRSAAVKHLPSACRLRPATTPKIGILSPSLTARFSG